MLAAQLPCVARDAYTVGREVAKGGIGRVLQARDQRLDRPVAIKELLVWNEKQEQRFMREALLTARLQHPAIVPIYEAGRWPDGEPFYAMKLVSGRSLSELIDERASLAERLSLLPHVLAVAQAIAYAHSKRIIHRDLKPANVLVGELGETVVIDWGLAKDLADEEPVSDGGTESVGGEGLTLQGAIVGTPSYMPPEQAAGVLVDERADVYALGAMLYHLLAAVPPYHDAPWERLLRTIAEKPPRRIEELAPQISDELAAIVNKAMAREPVARYRNAREMAEDLERFQTGQIVAAHTYSAGQILRRYWRRNRSALSVAAAAIGLVTLVVIVAFVKTDRERRFAQVKEREAVEASRAAETARSSAEEAGRQATARADEMTLLHAQTALGRDPNQALAWLKTLSPAFADATRVRRIAADAHARGISRAFHGHTAHINRLFVSPDGARFVTASDDKTARVWEVATGRSVLLEGHDDEVWNAQFLRGGDEVVTLSKDATLRTWNARTGAQRTKLAVPGAMRQLVVRADGAIVGGPMVGGAPWILRPSASTLEILSTPGERTMWTYFSMDGMRLIVQPEGGEAYLRDTDSGSKMALPGAPHGQWFLDLHGKLALRLGEGPAELWNLATMTRRKLEVSSSSRSAVFSHRGDLLAFPVDSTVVVYNTRSGDLVRRLTGHDGSVQMVTFSEDGERLASGASDRSDRMVRTWDLATGQSEVHAGFAGRPTDFKFLPGGRRMIAASGSGEVRLFEPRRAGKILTDHGGPATGLALSRDGRTASIDERGRLRIGDLEGRILAEHILPGSPNVYLLGAPDGRAFAGAALAWASSIDGRHPSRTAPPGAFLLGTFDGAAPRRIELPSALLDFAWLPDESAAIALMDGTVRRVSRDGLGAELDRREEPATSVAVSADGVWIAAGAEDGTVRLTETATGHHRELDRHKARVTALAFSADGTWLASGCADHTARLFRLSDGTFRSFDEGGYGVEQLAFSPDSKMLILLSRGEAQLRRLRVEAGEHLAPLPGHRGGLNGFSMSEDGRRLLAFGTDGATRLIDLSDGEGRALQGHAQAVVNAGFAPGGRAIVTLGREGTMRMWPDDLPEGMTELRAWIEAATPERIPGQ